MGRVAVSSPEMSDRALHLFANALVWDNHTVPAMRIGNPDALRHLRRHKAAGVDVVCVNVGFDGQPNEVIHFLADFRRWLTINNEEFALIGTAEDIGEARNQGKLAVCFDLEGGCALFENVNMVALYYDLGVRWMLFAYNRNNHLAGGCEDEDTGLTRFGREVLAEMERIGMLVCCSHIGHRSAMEILDVATRPVIFSHSNPMGISMHRRNIHDEAIKACARTGGVVGINGIGAFLGDNDIRTERLVDHIDYVVDLVGSQHVGIGLDYAFEINMDEVDAFINANPHLYPPGGYPNPREMRFVEPERFPLIAEELLRRKYTDAEVSNIVGGNFMRVARQVWK